MVEIPVLATLGLSLLVTCLISLKFCHSFPALSAGEATRSPSRAI